MISIGDGFAQQEDVATFAIQPVALSLVDVSYSTVGSVPSTVFWVLGVLATFVGSSLTVIGFMLQKRAHSFLKGEDPRYWTDWRWLLGLLVWFCGQALSWLADGLANKSLLACFNCWNIIIVLVLAPWAFRETVSKNAMLGALIVVGGCVWIVVFGPKTYYEQTLHSIADGFSKNSFLCVLGVSLCVPASVFARCVYRSWSRPSAEEYAILSAFCAWYAVLASKCTSMLFLTTVRTKNQMNSWEFYMFAVVVLLFAIAQMHTLNVGLRRGAAIFVLPTYEACSMTGQLIFCGVFFGKFRDFGISSLIVFWLGALIVVIGVVVLTRSGASDSAPNHLVAPEATAVDGLGYAHERAEAIRVRGASLKDGFFNSGS